MSAYSLTQIKNTKQKEMSQIKSKKCQNSWNPSEKMEKVSFEPGVEESSEGEIGDELRWDASDRDCRWHLRPFVTPSSIIRCWSNVGSEFLQALWVPTAGKVKATLAKVAAT